MESLEKKLADLSISKLKMIDLFAGTGAFSLAFEKSMTCVMANDKEPSSKVIYEKNHPGVDFRLCDLNDIKDEDIPEHDLLCGGFPCQPFSIAGKQRGFNDPRSNVFWKIISILKFRKPRFVILENVKNVRTHNNGRTFKTVMDALKDAGYTVDVLVLNTCIHTKVPQNRERTYFVCFRETHDHQGFDDMVPEVDKCDQIAGYLETEIPNKYYYTESLKSFKTISGGVTKHINTNTIYQYRRHYVRENKSNVCPTLTANMGSGGHNVPLIRDDKGIRKLTPRECFNLQGFPKKYDMAGLSDARLYKLAGNAVSVPIVGLIADLISECMKVA